MSDLWKDKAGKTSLPGFPIEISDEDGKWTKRPLTARGHLNASTDVDRFDWSVANGFGIRMGQGLYALDIDDYKNASPVTLAAIRRVSD